MVGWVKDPGQSVTGDPACPCPDVITLITLPALFQPTYKVTSSFPPTSETKKTRNQRLHESPEWDNHLYLGRVDSGLHEAGRRLVPDHLFCNIGQGNTENFFEEVPERRVP